jgi:hypothetical protein
MKKYFFKLPPNSITPSIRLNEAPFHGFQLNIRDVAILFTSEKIAAIGLFSLTSLKNMIEIPRAILGSLEIPDKNDI